jgi:sulfite reductase alpha subunit-like flavoprotein
MMENYQRSVDDATSNLVEQRVKLAKDIEIYSDLIKNATEDTRTYLSLAQSKKQVELAQLDYEIATTKVKAMQKGLSELGSFANVDLSNSVTATNIKAIELSKSIIDIKTKKDDLKNNIREEVHKLVTARSSRLKWRDFLYFSVITATTVGYGDIVPNSDTVRYAVMIEILLCIVVFGLLISLVTQTKS